MKICHLTTAHPRYDIRIFHKECRSLSKVYGNIWLVVADGLGAEIKDGIHIVDIGKPSGRKERWLKTRHKALKAVMEINPDIVHFHDPEFIPAAKKLAKRNFKIVYDIHEDVPRQILDKPYLKRFTAKILSYLFEIYENAAVKKFSMLCCATPHITNRFKKIHTNVVNINNFPLADEIINNETAHERDKSKICYIGGISEIRGLFNMLDALTYCKLRLDLAGTFENENLKNKAQKTAGWANVNELGQVDRQTAFKIKTTALAGLVTFLPAANHINAQPNKLFEYMAAGLPVISSNFQLWKEIIDNNNCGITVNPASSKEIADAIMYLYNNPETAKKMGQNGREAVKNIYNWEVNEKALLKAYDILIN